MPNFRVNVPASQGRELTVGSVVAGEVRGSVVSVSEAFGDDDDTVEVEVDGEASLRPGSLQDAAELAFTKLSNAKGPVDFPMGQRELHAP